MQNKTRVTPACPAVSIVFIYIIYIQYNIIKLEFMDKYPRLDIGDHHGLKVTMYCLTQSLYYASDCQLFQLIRVFQNRRAGQSIYLQLLVNSSQMLLLSRLRNTGVDKRRSTIGDVRWHVVCTSWTLCSPTVDPVRLVYCKYIHQGLVSYMTHVWSLLLNFMTPCSIWTGTLTLVRPIVTNKLGVVHWCYANTPLEWTSMFLCWRYDVVCFGRFIFYFLL